MKAPDLPRLGALALLWLMTRRGQRGPRSELSRALRPFVSHRWSGGEWSGRLDGLLAKVEEDGLVCRGARGGLLLTEEGRARALAWLGVERLARGTSWRRLKQTHLVARALGAPASTGYVQQLGSADGLCAILLKREHGLATPEPPTLAQARDALLWKQLGLETDRPFTLRAVRSVLLGRALQTSREPDPDQALRLLAARSLGARRTEVEELRLAALRSWLLSEEEEPSPPRVPDLEAFAHRVLEAARACPTGRFGEGRVFISHVFRNVPDLGMDAQRFKERLIEANRARLLSLTRADLVEAMSPADVRDSELEYLGERFHFVAI